MTSSGNPLGSGDTSINSSSSASLSAKNSLKRSRILYAINPQTTFIPTTDPIVLQNSIDRRKRQVIRNNIDHRQKSGSNGTLAIVTTTQGDGDNGGALKMKPVSSSALAIQNKGTGKEDTKKTILKNNKQGGGILVVSFEILWHWIQYRFNPSRILAEISFSLSPRIAALF